MSDPRLLWWIDRSTGMVSLLLLTLVMLFGVASTGRPGSALRTRTHAQAMHRQLALLSALLLAVHIGTAVADSFVPLTIRDVLVPFGAGYRPVWIGLGSAALDILVVVLLTSALRTRLPERAWRGVHRLAYLLWPMSIVHALGSGSDLHTRVVPAVGAGCLLVVAACAGWRLASGRVPAVRRVVGLSIVLIVVVGISGWATDGPLASGWAKRAAGAP